MPCGYIPRVTTPPGAEPLVIGLAGGIGAGKSAVARAFGRAGCAVIDSDAEARAALNRPEVLTTLKKWWGASVVGADGKADRVGLARVVFANAAERKRLEDLVHPLIRRTRASAQAEARRAGAPAIVYDAPLLFEAGLDALCDAVVWVECPRGERLRRVRESRGWDEAELTRREAAQWDADLKRSKCPHRIDNSAPSPGGGGPEADRVLDERVGGLLAILLGGRASGRTGTE